MNWTAETEARYREWEREPERPWNKGGIPLPPLAQPVTQLAPAPICQPRRRGPKPKPVGPLFLAGGGSLRQKARQAGVSFMTVWRRLKGRAT